MTHRFTSADIQAMLFPTPSAAQRQAAIDHLYRDGLARGLELEAEGRLVVDWEPDEEEAAEIEAHNKVTRARIDAMSSEEYQDFLDAQADEYMARTDRGWR